MANDDRRGYQREVARLLDEIDAQTSRRALLEAAGARHGALAGLARESDGTRQRLAALIAQRSYADASRRLADTVRKANGPCR